MKTIWRWLATTACLSSLITACGGDDEPEIRDQSGRFTVTIENVAPFRRALHVGAFLAPNGSGSTGPISSDEVFRFNFRAAPGASLSLVTMLIPSNDFFIAPTAPEGIPLFFETLTPRNGLEVDDFQVWDAGTEENQDLGAGDRQRNNLPGGGGISAGEEDPDNTVRPAMDPELPAIEELVSFILNNSPTTEDGTLFTVTMENETNGDSLRLPDGSRRNMVLSPGVFAVHLPNQPAPFFTPGEPDRGDGLEILAEDGIVEGLVDPNTLRPIFTSTGPNVQLSPGVFVVYEGDDNPIFSLGEPASEGLEALAERGRGARLLDRLNREMEEGSMGIRSAGAFEIPEGADQAGPIDPTPEDAMERQRYTFTFEASPGAKLSLASMVMPTNDVFLSTDPDGIRLFQTVDGFQRPIPVQEVEGLVLYDAGTERNQEPGYGNGQPIGTFNDEEADGEPTVENVRRLDEVQDGFNYLRPAQLVRVRISSTPL